MAANNYFGFAHGGSQYSAAAFQAAGSAAAAGYAAVGHTPAATYAAQRASAAYETAAAATAAVAAATFQPPPTAAATSYSATPTPTGSSYDYSAYQRAQQYAVGADSQQKAAKSSFYTPPPVTGFSAGGDSSYQAGAAGGRVPFTMSKSSGGSYTPSYQTSSRPGQPSLKTYSYPASGSTAQSSYNYSTPSSASKNYSGYDAALYNAATLYVQQQATSKNVRPWRSPRGFGSSTRPKPVARPEQLHYCDVCRISCAGPQTYREHLDGQKHKKKEAAQKLSDKPSVSQARVGNSLRCELCDVTCTGSDAYAAHLRGAKHQKVVKLHTKLGKPIPSTDPVVVSGKSSSAVTVTGAAAPPQKSVADAAVTTTKITFVAGSKLSTSGTQQTPAKPAEPVQPTAKDEMLAAAAAALGEKEIEPVGQQYIEEIKNEEGRVMSFNCKLCECRFNDPNAKEMHMKGRRHRLQYKRKVDPELVVEVKLGVHQRKLQERKRRQTEQLQQQRRRREEAAAGPEDGFWGERPAVDWFRPGPPFPPHMMPPHFMPGPYMVRRLASQDDRHVMAKHSSIYPKDDELANIQKVVSNAEKALKMVSDEIAQSEAPKVEPGVATKPLSEEVGRTLKGVMRVGVLAKGLLLHGDSVVRLVVLCAEKPTRTLLERVASCLPKHLETVCPNDKYTLKLSVENASIVLTAQTCGVDVTVTLTSPLMRETATSDGDSTVVKDPPDVLDKQKCLEALAALRHAKWFQARASGIQSCVIVIRIMRDLCQRVPTWAPLNTWTLELLVERVLGSAMVPLTPGEALRRLLEAVSGGLLLPGAPGLLDPCEKEPTDTLSGMKMQQREDITASAQHTLRLMAFRQLHRVLGMDPLPYKYGQQQTAGARKRRRENAAAGAPAAAASSAENGDSEGSDDKKMKKEEQTQK